MRIETTEIDHVSVERWPGLCYEARAWWDPAEEFSACLPVYGASPGEALGALADRLGFAGLDGLEEAVGRGELTISE